MDYETEALYDSQEFDNLFLLLIIFQRKWKRQQKLLKDIDRRKFNSIELRRALNGTIRRRSLQHPDNSVFWKVYDANQDESLIQMCGLTKQSFVRVGYEGFARFFS